MTEQQLVAYTSDEGFSEQVNNLMEQGWKVVAGTHEVFKVTGFRPYYGIVLERLIPYTRSEIVRITLEWWDGDKWIFANDCPSTEFAKISLGADNHNYRTVDATGEVTWCTKEGEEV